MKKITDKMVAQADGNVFLLADAAGAFSGEDFARVEQRAGVSASECALELLPADPLALGDAELDALSARFGQLGSRLKAVVTDMRRRVERPDDLLKAGGGTNRWYAATYCATAEDRRRHVAAMLTATHVG